MTYHSIAYNPQEELGKGEDDPDSTDAILCGACGAGECAACMALKAANKRIPKDVKVIGCDDVFVTAIVEPPLSTVHIRKNLLGTEAIHALLEQLENRRVGSVKRLELENHLVVRESTDRVNRSYLVPSEW